MKNFLLIFLGACLLTFFSCGIGQKKFDSTQWNKKSDQFYLNRESMVDDLMKNHLRKGQAYKEVILLLGEYNDISTTEPYTISYEIMVDYGRDIDPVEGKDLYIKFTKDSTIVTYWLEHWKH